MFIGSYFASSIGKTCVGYVINLKFYNLILIKEKFQNKFFTDLILD